MDPLGVPSADIAALAAVPAPAARQRLLHLAGGGLLIDDSYNASPLSMLAALDLLAAQHASRRVAILADMLELGPLAEVSHRSVGARAAEVADLLVAVGPLPAISAEAAGSVRSGSRIRPRSMRRCPPCCRPGDAMLVKGSRGMAMEDVVGWLSDAS